jgi:di/tricarboxylate transporter
MVFWLLAFTHLGPDLVLLAALGLLLVTGVLDTRQALEGFANEGMITVGILFVVGAGVRDTGAVNWLAEKLFGRPKSTLGAVTRVVGPATVLSAFMNNTPLVAMLIPAVNEWAAKFRIPPSKLMIPLSYAAILGGTCTLIGTSTNLVVNGLMTTQAGLPALGMFEVSWVGVPAAIIGGAYLIACAAWLLPDRRPAISQLGDPKEYTVEMMVEEGSLLEGKTIEQAGLRHLAGVYLAEIDRDGSILPAVAPQEKLHGGDRLVFVGVVDSVVELQKIRGLIPATNQVFKLGEPRSERCLIEAVVSTSCPLVGKTIRAGRFRSVYGAAVVAVARGGERVRSKIGDIELEPGDTLLLEAHPSFYERQRNSRDFYLISQLENSTPLRHDRAILSILILLSMVVAVTMGLSMLKGSALAAALMLAFGCVSGNSARRSIDWPVLLAIAASFGLGKALEITKAADGITSALVESTAGNPWIALAMVYLVTVVVTELITNNAAAALMFPFAISTSTNLGVNYMPFVIAVMMAASAGFATPIGYQTNLMVMGPGGYRFSDYVKIGVPLDLLVGVITVAIAPFVWPFH